jgi:predicted transposase YbfD/YdcC
MATRKHVGLDEVCCHFADLEDPRSAINQKHPLVSVIVISLIAVLSGADGPTAIAQWAKIKKDLLIKSLDLPKGIPAKDVFRRVLSCLQPLAFQECFANWLKSLREHAAEELGIEQPVFNIDGKTLRRSHDHSRGLGALHSVSVWASEFGLTLAQVACAEKSNEITAIPEVLRLVDVKGAIITIDAMGTQTEIAAQIVEAEGDYVLALKGNQGTLHQGVIEYIDEQIKTDFANLKARRSVTQETGHGREETRVYVQMPAPTSLPGFSRWKGLKSIGLVLNTCQRNGKETTEVRYYISSLAVGIKRFIRAVRGHWGIENTCHWCLDVTYREDESRIRDEHMRDNFAWLRRFTLSLLKQHPGKQSIAMKRRCCGWSEEFLLEVLVGKTT